MTYRKAMANIGKYLHVELLAAPGQDLDCPAPFLGLKQFIYTRNRQEEGFCFSLSFMFPGQSFLRRSPS